MCRGDLCEVFQNLDGFKELVTDFSGTSLKGGPVLYDKCARVRAVNEVLHTVAVSKTLDKSFVFIGFAAPEFMIYVRNGNLNVHAVLKLHHQIQEHRRIYTARNAYDYPVPVRNKLMLANIILKSIEEIAQHSPLLSSTRSWFPQPVREFSKKVITRRRELQFSAVAQNLFSLNG
jgi:hypothetical protein